MKSKITLCLMFVLIGSLKLKAGIIESRPFNVYAWNMNLFESLEHNADVYVCSVVKREPWQAESGRNIERGVVMLNVVKVLRGKNRKNIILPYSFIPVGGLGIDGPLIWPVLDGLENKYILCVIVPDGEDPTTPKKTGVQEAASKVVVVDDDEAAVSEMKRLCELYDDQITPDSIKALKQAVGSLQPTVRRFALETTIMKLGKASPDAAYEIIKARAAIYREFTKDVTVARDPLDEESLLIYQQNPQTARSAYINEAEDLLGDIGNGFLKIGPDEKFCTFLCRCLVILTQSESKTIRTKAINALAGSISSYDYRPDLHFRPLDGLDVSEKNVLNRALADELQTGDTNTLANIRLIQKRLVQ